MQENQLSEFGVILLFIIGGALFVILALAFAKMIRPDRPNEEKLAAYECGEDAVGNVWTNFNVRFYIIALIFVLFEVEVIFLFPWATVFGNKTLIDETHGMWGWFALIEMGVFVFVLLLGLAYAWAKGHLDWIKPAPETEKFASKVPKKLYENINKKYQQRSEKVSV